MKKEDFKKFRKSKKLNQLEFAKFFGVTQAAISQYESGERLITEEIIKVVKAFPPMNKESAARKYQEGLEDDWFDRETPASKVEESFIAGVDWANANRDASAC